MNLNYFCSVCYTFHQEDKIILSCRGKHTICRLAYKKLKEYNIHFCPLCREQSLDKTISDALVIDLINNAIYTSRS